MRPILIAAVAGGLLAWSAGGNAEDDPFAGCPDPEAARAHVKKCMQQNPYVPEEVCTRRALEEVCGDRK